jgi:peptidoglycan/xylan/chitin deacetylase (PgdA/CDA1 family)
MSAWIGLQKSENPSELSRGEYGAAVGLPRVLDFLGERGIKATFCVPGHTVEAYPTLLKRMVAAGHEVAHHGWVHENPSDSDHDGEERNLLLGSEAIEGAMGSRPAGYRSPAWDLSRDTIRLLLEHGFLYDSSCMGGDFYPYYLRQGDEWSTDGPYVFGEVTKLVEVPVYWGLDDFPLFEFTLAGQGLAAPSAVEEIWRGDFEYAYANCPGGVFNLTMHPEVIARGHRLRMLGRLVDHFGDMEGVVFETLGSFVGRWRAENPLAHWKTENPLRVNPRAGAANGKLPYRQSVETEDSQEPEERTRA